MKFHSKDTFLRNMMCNSSIQNHIFMNFCLLLVEIEYEISFKWYLHEKYDTNHFNSKSKFYKFVFIVTWNWVWNFIQMIPPWKIWHTTLQFQIKFVKILRAYCWLKLVWNFIQKIPPWEIWCVTLQFKILFSWIFAYC